MQIRRLAEYYLSANAYKCAPAACRSYVIGCCRSLFFRPVTYGTRQNNGNDRTCVGGENEASTVSGVTVYDPNRIYTTQFFIGPTEIWF